MSEDYSKYTFSFIYPLWQNLSIRRKRQLLISLILIILNGLLDLISVTSILPLLYLLTSQPERIMNHYFVKTVANFLYIEDPNQLLIYSTILFAIVAVLSGSLKLSNLYYTSRISGAISGDFSSQIFSKVLYQPYSYHVELNSSEVITSITTYINALNAGLISVLQFITSLILSFFIIIGVLLVNWQLSLIGFFIYLLIYLLIASFSKRILNNNSKTVADSNKYIVKSVQEALGSIRDIILDNLHVFYTKSHKKREHAMRKLIAQNMFLTFFPRYALESITLVLISLIIIFKQNIFDITDPIIPTLGSLSIGIQKLLPSFQSIYISWASINSQKASIIKLLKFIKLQNDNIINKERSYSKSSGENSFNFNSLKIHNLSFKYPSNDKFIFENLNLEIKKGEKIGIIGKTGDGKSTLLDLLMGLVKPSSGNIFVNDKNIFLNRNFLDLWRKKISHVPQNIYLTDRTIAENIALGTNIKNIQFERLQNAAVQAKIDDFINNLDMRYYSSIGEGGLKISGGQRQRLGIARALYNKPEILILDEATSALDQKTEDSIMQSLNNISKNITIIVVTHRLKTLKYCDRVIELEKGKIIFDGK